MPTRLNSTPFVSSFMRFTFAALSLAFASASFAQTAAPTTVKVGNFTKQTVGTVTNINEGDLGCYVSLKDDQGKAFEELADFAICEKPKSYLGRRVSLSYTMSSVMADSCQGDPSCKKTRAVALVQSLTVLGAKTTGSTSSPVASAAPAALSGQASFCTAQETVVFSCRTGVKMVSVCASKNATQSKGYLQYRFGKPDSNEAPELMLPEGQLTANKAASGETVPFAGGAGSWLRFKKGSYSYVAYSGVGKWGPKGETREKNGLVVERSGKAVANLKCTGDATSELGPEWYEKMGVQPKGDEDFLFPD